MDIVSLKQWMEEELFAHANEYCSAIIFPDIADLQEMCRGRNTEIWKYAMKHVFSAQTVQKVKGNLKLKHALSNQPSKEALQKKSELIDQFLKSQAKKKHLEKTVGEMHSKVVAAESRIAVSKARVAQLRHKTALRKKYHCMIEEKISKYEELNNELNKRINEFQQSSKSSKKSLYVPGNDGNLSALDSALGVSIPNALREVSEIIKKSCIINDDKPPSFDREALHITKKGLWQQMNNILQAHTLPQVISCVTAHTQEAAMIIKKQCEEVDLPKDVKVLESKSGGRENEIHNSCSIRNFLEVSRVLHIEKFLETEKNKNAVVKFQNEAFLLKKAISSNLSIHLEQKEKLQLAMSLFELEAREAGRKNIVKNLKKELANVEMNISNLNQMKTDLLSKYQKIKNFEGTVKSRQDLLCNFKRQNLVTATRATAEQEQLNKYVEKIVLNNRLQNEERSHELQDLVKKEVHVFKTLTLPRLFTISLKSCQYVPVQNLSIYMLQDQFEPEKSLAIHGLRAALNLLPYEGSECLLQKAIALKTMLKKNRVLADMKKNVLDHMKSERKRFNTTCITDLTSQLKIQSRDELKTILPTVKEMSLACDKSMVLCQQLKDALYDWKDQPAQLLVPDITIEGKTVQQWLQLWTTTFMELTNIRCKK